MRFRGFGPVEFRAGHTWSGVPGARPRTLLALLLIEAGVPLSVERIAHEMWDGRPPPSAASAVRGYALKLRRALGRELGELIVTRSGGYELQCERTAIDVFRFKALTDRARPALLADEAELAWAALNEALGLWRSECFADAQSTEAIVAECRRLAECRIDATILLSEAGLRLGRGGEVLDRLRALAAENPLSEGLWRQLMRVLNALGRRAEALAAYRGVRRLLLDELGVEPGRELQDLHQAILEDRGPAGGAVPKELARGTGVFVGRHTEVDELCRLIGGAGVAIIEGLGGIGKSELAIQVAQRLEDSFPDGQLHIDLRGASDTLEPLTPLEALGHMLRALGADPRYLPTETAEATARFRSLTAGRRMLFLLDNAAGPAQVRPLLPGRSCAVLVTSRRGMAALGGAVRQLGPLRPEESTTMLTSLVGARRALAEPEEVLRITRLCGHLPLALRICGARLIARPNWELRVLADRLADEQHRLDELVLDDLAVRASLEVSCRDLDRDSLRMFRLLGLLSWSLLTAPVAAALTGSPPAVCESLMEKLLDARLLDSPGPGRYRMHDLVRLFAREQAERHLGAAESGAARRAVFTSFVATGLRATELITPRYLRQLTPEERALTGPADFGMTAAEAVAWVDAERHNVLAAAAQAAARPDEEDLAVAIAAALTGPLGIRGHWQDKITLNELALRVAERRGDLAAQARSCMHLCYTYGMMGKAENVLPLLRRAQSLWEQTGSATGRAHVMNGFGTLAMRLGSIDEGIALLERGLAGFERAGEAHDAVLVRHQLGIAHEKRGDPDTAVRYLREAAELAAELGYRHGEYYTLLALARNHRGRGEPARAIRDFRRALECARETGERYGEPELLWELGSALHELGRDGEAAQHRGEALDILAGMDALTPQEIAELRANPPARLPAPLDHDRRWAVVNAHLRLAPGMATTLGQTPAHDSENPIGG